MHPKPPPLIALLAAAALTVMTMCFFGSNDATASPPPRDALALPLAAPATAPVLAAPAPNVGLELRALSAPELALVAALAPYAALAEVHGAALVLPPEALAAEVVPLDYDGAPGDALYGGPSRFRSTMLWRSHPRTSNPTVLAMRPAGPHRLE